MSLGVKTRDGFLVTVERPEPPVVGKVTHHSIELDWSNTKAKLSPHKRYRFTIQESDLSKRDWGVIYSGYGTTMIVECLEPATEYNYRLCVVNPENERSDYSQAVVVKTTSKNWEC